MNCAYHPDREPVGACVSCGKLICVECKTIIKDKIYCNPCVEKIFAQGIPDSKPEEPKSKAEQEYIEREDIVIASDTKEQSTKDEKPAKKTLTERPLELSTELPAELRGWNWGAFLLNWIWGIGNNVWISLLMFIPGVNIVMWFVLGAKGNEWAWKYKKWNSIEHFKKTQRTWAKWGIIIFAIYVVLLVIGIISSFLFPIVITI